MPRPKRTKVASKATTRVAQSSKVADPVPVSRIRASTTKPTARTNAKTNDHLNSFSDDSDGLVVKTTTVRVRKPWEPTPQKDVDVTMTGALPLGSNDDGVSEKRTRARSPIVKIPSSIHHKLASSSSKKTRTTSVRGKKAQPVEATPAATFSRRTSSRNAAEAEGDSWPSLDLGSFSSLDEESPAHGTRPPSAIKVHATPGHDTSILLANFKRRARQPSILRMVHQTTDVEDNDLGDLDDFNPDDESTPLQLEKSGVENEEQGKDSSGLSLGSTDSRGKKRKLKSPEIQVPRSSPPYAPASGSDVGRSPSPSLPGDIRSSREEVPETQDDPEPVPQIMSETMAPPRSSSPPVEEREVSPVKQRKTRKRRNVTRISDYGHDPDSADEEPQTRTKTRGRNNKDQSFSTARLEALLPRRRTRAPQQRDEFDIQSSEELDATLIDSDQDELALPTRRVTSLRTSAPAPKPTKKGRGRPKKAAATPAPAPIRTKSTRTYGRVSSDKENDNRITLDDDDKLSDDEDGGQDQSTETINLSSAELGAIAKKFEDVDAWEMDFESVDVTGGSSSPWR